MNTRAQAAIEKRNEMFAGATLSEKRVMIAKDVISLLRQKKITLGSTFFDMGYFGFDWDDPATPAEPSTTVFVGDTSNAKTHAG